MIKQETVDKYLAFIKDDNSKKRAVYPYLKKTKVAGVGHPEEFVRLTVYNELLLKYCYPPELIDIEVEVRIREDERPRFADIVVFDDTTKKRPFLVCEVKKPKKEEGEKQGQRYATILRAVYVLWTNGTSRSASVLVNRYPENAAPISDIPVFGGAPKLTITSLIPFTDDRQITDVFRKCHNLIRNLSNLKPDAAFAEFLKVLLVKFRDETKGYDFECQVFLRGQPPTPEPSNETAQRMRLLYKQAIDEEGDVADAFDRSGDILLTNDCLTQLIETLQLFSFTTTPVDQKGRAFETFISGDLRQEFKEFMTPRPVVEAMIQWADPDTTDSILDPCCGSGAFLINALTYVRKKIESRNYTARQKIKLAFDYAHDKLWGFDASEQMSAVARINMLVNEDGRAHVFHRDALPKKKHAPEIVRNKSFQLILTNPPFGKRISYKTSILADFEIVRDGRGNIPKHAFLTEILFIERDLEWLQHGGYLFIVLPDSVLGNATLSEARDNIERWAQLVAVISLSSDTFGPAGAKNKTSVVVLCKRPRKLEVDEQDDEYSVFVAHIPNIGYDFTGRATGMNDLPLVTEEFKQFRSTGEAGSRLTRVISRAQLGNCWLAQPHLEVMARTSKKDSLTLGEICFEGIRTGKTAPRASYTDSGVHLIKVGNLTGRGIEWDAVERQYVDLDFACKYPKAHLKPLDILFTASAHGPKWIGLKVDIFEQVPPHLTQPVMACGEIMICSIAPNFQLDPYYLLLFLRSPMGYAAIQKCIRGQSGHIYPDQVAEIVVPKPTTKKIKELDDALQALRCALDARRQALALEARCARLAAIAFPSDIKKPIIAL
jgi:type I restriction enzyme M protein